MYTEPAFSSTAQHDQSRLVSSIILLCSRTCCCLCSL